MRNIGIYVSHLLDSRIQASVGVASSWSKRTGLRRSLPERAGAGAESRPAAGQCTAGAALGLGLLLLLCTMNLFDSVDRWLLAAVLPKVRRSSIFRRARRAGSRRSCCSAWPMASPLVGYLVDRIKRPRLLAIGFAHLEPGDGLDWAGPDERTDPSGPGRGGRRRGDFSGHRADLDHGLVSACHPGGALAAFFLAVPLGAAVAVSFGAALAKLTNWQVAFLACGTPGLVLALLCAVFPDPTRGLERRGRPRAPPAARKGRCQPRGLHGFDGQFLLHLLALRHHVLVVRIRRAVLLVEGVSDRVQGFHASLLSIPSLGISFLAAAIAGTLAGGLLAELDLEVKTHGRCSSFPGLAMLATILWFWSRSTRGRPGSFRGPQLATGVMFMNIVPCYTIISSVTMPNMRGVGCGVALGGRASSGRHLVADTLMGWVADTFGQRDSMATGFGRALAASARAGGTALGLDPQNLTAAMLVVIPGPVDLGNRTAGRVASFAARKMATLQAKLRARPSRLARNRRPPARQ